MAPVEVRHHQVLTARQDCLRAQGDVAPDVRLAACSTGASSPGRETPADARPPPPRQPRRAAPPRQRCHGAGSSRTPGRPPPGPARSGRPGSGSRRGPRSLVLAARARLLHPAGAAVAVEAVGVEPDLAQAVLAHVRERAGPAACCAVWHGSAVPSGVTVRNMLPQPLTHFFGRALVVVGRDEEDAHACRPACARQASVTASARSQLLARRQQLRRG